MEDGMQILSFSSKAAGTYSLYYLPLWRHPLRIYRAERHRQRQRRSTHRSLPGPAVTSAAISAVRGVAEKSRPPLARFLVLMIVPGSLAAARLDAIIRPGPGCLAFAICST